MSAPFPGSVLRERRELRGYTLVQVFEHIHVPAEHLRALEEGRLDVLPAITYSSGFLTSYCDFLGLPPEPYVDKLRGAMKRRQVAAPPRPLQQVLLPNSGPERPVWLAEAITWGTICGILLLGWVTYSTIIQPLAPNPDERVQADTLEEPVHFEEEE
jgi:cytoskeletal protein RodZ